MKGVVDSRRRKSLMRLALDEHRACHLNIDGLQLLLNLLFPLHCSVDVVAADGAEQDCYSGLLHYSEGQQQHHYWLHRQLTLTLST